MTQLLFLREETRLVARETLKNNHAHGVMCTEVRVILKCCRSMQTSVKASLVLTHVHRLRSNICSPEGQLSLKTSGMGNMKHIKVTAFLGAFKEELMERCSGDSVT